MTERFTDYDPFAWIYNARWGADYHRQALHMLDQTLLSHLPSGAAILDVGCGAGHVTALLAARGYRMIGLDGSAEMLRYAHEKLPDAEFHLADARWFTLPERVPAAIATFDALNHIMAPSELACAFRCVHEALQEGGRFVFDLNREEAYRDFWGQFDLKVEDEVVCLARGGYDAANRAATCDVTLFRLLDGQWQRADFTLRQRCHTDAEVRDGLRAAGFVEIEARDAREDLGMWGNVGRGRTYYSARRATLST